ncbi:MAG: EutN/CcmL family microcompartment protein [Melioribacteraceae bacterium]|nr:EutN/CcmL family microcompartment protein [Melioribacteraceae bacterium]
MILGIVKGNLVSTIKNEYLRGHKLLLISQIDINGNLLDKQEVIALDLVDAGIGDKVIVVQEGDAIQQMLGHSNAPVNTMIICVVDNIEVIEN